MDEALFRWINGWPESWKPFFWFLSEATKLDWVRVVLALFVLGLLLASPRTRTAAVIALLAWGLANGFTEALKNGFQMARPSVELPDGNFRVKPLTSWGTASSHAANMMAVGVACTAYLGRFGWLWLGLAVLVGLSRIYVGVHYPSQVLLGWACGAFVAWMLVTMQRRWTRLRKPKEEGAADALNPPPAS
jgi:undecaprenyl-diphosphatase